MSMIIRDEPIGKLTLACRSFTIKDLVEYSSAKNWIGKIVKGLKLFFSFKGIMTDNDLKLILEHFKNHPQRESFLENQNLQTLFKTYHIAIPKIQDTVVKSPSPKLAIVKEVSQDAGNALILTAVQPILEQAQPKVENTQIDKTLQEKKEDTKVLFPSEPINDQNAKIDHASQEKKEDTIVLSPSPIPQTETKLVTEDITSSLATTVSPLEQSETHPAKESIIPENRITKKVKPTVRAKNMKKGLKTGQDLFNYYVNYEAKKYINANRALHKKFIDEKDRPPSTKNQQGWYINDCKINDDQFVNDLIQFFLNIFPIKGEERLKISEFIQRQIEIKLSENSLIENKHEKHSKAGALSYVIALGCRDFKGNDLTSEEEKESHEKLIVEGEKIFLEFKEKYRLTDVESKQIVKNVALESLKIAEQKLNDRDFDRTHQWDFSEHRLIERQWNKEVDGEFFPNRSLESGPAKRDLEMLALSCFVESFFDEKEEDAVNTYLVNQITGKHKQRYIHHNNMHSNSREKLEEFFNEFISSTP